MMPELRPEAKALVEKVTLILFTLFIIVTKFLI